MEIGMCNRLIICSIYLVFLLAQGNSVPSSNGLQSSQEIRNDTDTTSTKPEPLIPANKEDFQTLNGKNESCPRLWLIPPNYNNLEIPIVSKRHRIMVKISLFIRTVLDIDEQNEDVDLGLVWKDFKIFEYLESINFTEPNTGKPVGNRTLDSEALKQIWKPDISIDQMSSMEKTSILAQSVQLHFLFARFRNATMSQSWSYIQYFARLQLKLRCGMEFTHFPADTQTCIYHFRSYAYDQDKLVLYWKKSSVYLEDPKDANFDLQLHGVEPGEEYKKLTIEEGFDSYRWGNYSVLQFTLKARRNLSYHLVQTYLPSVLLILITWLCFLLPSSMVEARIGISMTTVLTLTAMFASVRQSSPKVSYTMAIDIWMVFNIFFVFIALLLFTFTYWLKLQLDHRQKKINDADETDIHDGDLLAIETYQMVVNFNNRYAFWAFSATFLLFLVVYWIWLISASKYFDWNPNPRYNTIIEDHAEVFPWTTGKYILHKTK